MNLYLIYQSVNNDWDTYDSAVVLAETEEEARMTHPQYPDGDGTGRSTDSWCAAADVQVTLLGLADDALVDTAKSRVICASFNAG